MKGFKGFNSKLQCTPNGKVFQYEIGKTYTEPTANLCNQGFHFVESPLDAMSYYKPNDGSRYCEVSGAGVSGQIKDDTKRACTSITIGAEIKIPAIVKAAVKFVLDRATSTTGNYAHSATTGDYAHSATTGNYAHSATTGYYAHSATTGDYAHSATTGYSAHSATTGNSAESSVSGKNSIAASLGIKGKAKATKGDWLVLAEYDDNGKIIAMGIAQVRGKIKADTFYSLKGGKFVEVEK